MTVQRRKRSVVTVGLIVVICGSAWLVWGTSGEAAMLLLEWPPPRSELAAAPPPQDFISAMQIGPVEESGSTAEAMADCHCIGKCGSPAITRVNTCVADGTACTADVNAACTQRGEATASVVCVDPWSTGGGTPKCFISCVDGTETLTFAPNGSLCVEDALKSCEPHGAVELVVWRDDGDCVRDPEWLCDGDLDGDGQVNPVDSGLVQAAFGSMDDQDLCNYDLDCDGQINPVDAGLV